jgi:hypothetical protein
MCSEQGKMHIPIGWRFTQWKMQEACNHGLPLLYTNRPLRCNRLDKEWILQTPAPRGRRKVGSLSNPLHEKSLLPPNEISPIPILGHISKTHTFSNSLFSSSAAFLGSTSFSSVFEEHKSDFLSEPTSVRGTDSNGHWT